VDYFKKYCSDKNLEEILTKAKDLDIDPNFPAIQTILQKIICSFFNYEHVDEPILDAKLNFKIDFLNKLIDQTLMSLNNRFEELETFNDNFDFLSNIFECSDDDLKNGKNLYIKLKEKI